MHVHPLRNNLGFHDVRLHDGYLHAYRRPTTPSYEDQRVADDYYWWLKQQLGVDADPVDTGLDCNSWVVRPGSTRKSITHKLGRQRVPRLSAPP